MGRRNAKVVEISRSINEGELERVGRGVIAGMLIVWACRSRGFGKLLLGTLAGAVGFTAFSGRSWLYDKLGVDTSETCTLDSLKKIVSPN